MCETDTSSLTEYIGNTLRTEYAFVRTLSDRAIGKTELYRKNTGEFLVKVTSYHRNDHVFRLLRGKALQSLPKIYEVASAQDALTVLEEYVDGNTLAEVLENGTLPTGRAVSIALDLCAALKELHTRNIIHRDLKPDNIIIRPDGHAVLIDFGVARLTSDKKRGDTMNLGTIGYAAPEQFGISQSGPTTDIYALGVVLNEMLLGVHPTIDMPKRRLGRIINRCVTTQISKRYPSVQDLEKALSSVSHQR